MQARAHANSTRPSDDSPWTATIFAGAAHQQDMTSPKAWRTVRLRAYPTPAQQALLRQQIAACRLAYRRVVAEHRDAERDGHEPPALGELHKRHARKGTVPPELRAAAPAAGLQQAVIDADQAARAARFRGRPWPRVDGAVSLDWPGAVTYAGGGEIKVPVGEGRERRVWLPLVGEVRVRAHVEVPDGTQVMRVEVDRGGRWHVAWVVPAPPARSFPPSGVAPTRIIAIDAGCGAKAHAVSLDLATWAVERWIIPHDHDERLAADLAEARKVITRREPGSAGHARAIARHEALIAKCERQRLEAHRIAAARLLDDAGVVVVENLDVSGLLRTGTAPRWVLRRAALSSFLAALASGAERREWVEVAPVPAAYSTRTCAVCLTMRGPLRLGRRAWTCAECGTRLDRDFNAAAVLLMRYLESTGSGADLDTRRRVELARAAS